MLTHPKEEGDKSKKYSDWLRVLNPVTQYK